MQTEPQCQFTTNLHPVQQQRPDRCWIMNTEELKCTNTPLI